MICEIPNCRKEVIPTGLPTGLQELLAMRIHLARDHKIRRDTMQMLEMRADQEKAGQLEPKGQIMIDTDRDEKWLD